MKSPLSALEREHLNFGSGAARRKLHLLDRLARERMANATALKRLHEVLCFMRAYPDDEPVRAKVQSLLASFANRPDLQTQRERLADTGIAGTDIHCRFFAGQAAWLAQRWPDRLRLDRRDAEARQRIAQALPALVTPTEAQALIELKPTAYAALDRLCGVGETDAVFLLRRIAVLPGTSFQREVFSDTIDASHVFALGPGAPSRTKAWWPGARVAARSRAPSRERPDLRTEIVRPPRSIRRLDLDESQDLIDLARGAMVTRARSLEAFSYAEPRDGWLADDGDGLAYAIFGVMPERRHALASYYGGLMLRNGVPIGYLQSDIVGRSAALSFNQFETFRGGEAAFVFARWLAVLRRLFGTTSFSIEPYQLGDHNDEALESGAWWFYAKLGFAPRDRAALALAQAERQRLQRRASHRSSPSTLARLARKHLFFDLEPEHPAPVVPLGEIGLSAGAALAARSGSDRERGCTFASAELAAQCGLASLRGFTRDEREAWIRFAAIAPLLGIASWREPERRALVPVIRAKGGTSERGYISRYLKHPRLAAAVDAWQRRG